MKLVCKIEFKHDETNFIVGESYEYWTNFGGLNHIVEDHSGYRYPFNGEPDDDRYCVWDYFITQDQWRDSQIDKLVKPHCHICYTTNVEPDIMVCDTCDEVYCEDCSYTFTPHYQHQGARCYWCSDQSRKEPITKDQIRDNKILLFVDLS